jgi:membrane-bound ClpP family serine protease
MGLIISLTLIGLILIFVEVMLIPGVGVAGILGLLSMGGSCFYAFHEFDNLTGGIVTGVNALLLLVSMIYLLRAKTWKKMTLNTNIDAKAVREETATLMIGQRGKTVTRLAPAGSVRFGDDIVEARTMDSIIDPETEVKVIMLDDNKIYVSVVNADE